MSGSGSLNATAWVYQRFGLLLLTSDFPSPDRQLCHVACKGGDGDARGRWWYNPENGPSSCPRSSACLLSRCRCPFSNKHGPKKAQRRLRFRFSDTLAALLIGYACFFCCHRDVPRRVVLRKPVPHGGARIPGHGPRTISIWCVQTRCCLRVATCWPC